MGAPGRGPDGAVSTRLSLGKTFLPWLPCLVFSTIRCLCWCPICPVGGRKPAQTLSGGCPCLAQTQLLLPSSLTTALLLQVACEYGMVHVVSEAGGPKGKDYCILYNPQWAHLPHDLGKAVSAHWGPSS